MDVDEKICIQCNISKAKTKFCGKVCNSCYCKNRCGDPVYQEKRRLYKKTLRLKLNSIFEEKVCEDCNESKSANKFQSIGGIICISCKDIKTKYGVSGLYVKNILISQNNRCGICPKLLSINRDGKREAHVDHNHAKERGHGFRGILCSNCNTAIGLFKENINYLKSAIQYLELHNRTTENVYIESSDSDDIDSDENLT